MCSVEKVFRLIARSGIRSKTTLFAILRAGVVLGIWGIQRDRFKKIEHDQMMIDILRDVDELEETVVSHRHRHRGTSGERSGISTNTTTKATETVSIHGDAAIAANFFSNENGVDEINLIRDDLNKEIIADTNTPDEMNESNDIIIDGGRSSRVATCTGYARRTDLRRKFYSAVLDSVGCTPRARQDTCITLAFTILLRCRPVFMVAEDDFRNDHGDQDQGQGHSANGNISTITDDKRHLRDLQVSRGCRHDVWATVTEPADRHGAGA